MTFFQRNEQAISQEKDKVEKQAAEWGVNAEIIYPRPGSTMLRFLPAYSEAGLFFKAITKHRVRTASGETFSGLCPSAAEDLPCAICEKAQELKDSGDHAKMQFAREQLRPQNKYLYNVLVFSAPADNKGKTPEFGKVYVLETGIMVHRQLISLDTDAMMGWVDITNLNNGVNLVIKRTGSGGLDTKYEVSPTGHGRSDVLKDLQARGFDPSQLTPIDLDKVYTVPSEEKLAEVVAGIKVVNFPQRGGQFQQFNPQQVPVVTAPPAPVAVAPPVIPAPVVGQPPTPVAPPTISPTVAPPTIKPPTTGDPLPTASPVTIMDTGSAPESVTAPTVPAPPIPAPPIPVPPKAE